MAVALRSAQPQDSAFAYDVRRVAFRIYVELGAAWDEEEEQRIHAARFRSYGYRIITHEAADVGVVVTEQQRDSVNLYQLFILPEHQGKGIGRQTMEIVMQDSRALGLPVRLRVLKVNTGGQQFFERLGFRASGETGSHRLLVSSL